MFSAARAVSKVNKKFVPWRPTKHQSQGQSSQPSHPEPMDEDHPAEGSGSQYQDQPGWVQNLISGFGNLQVQNNDHWEQTQQRWQGDDAFQQEVRYEMGAQRYHNAWQAHNTRRLSETVQDFQHTPYHYPPMWGQPGAVYPPPVYDETAALAELDEAYRRQQQRQGMDDFEPSTHSQSDWGVWPGEWPSAD